jgi:iron complex outermembrane receptor protein
MKLKKITQAFIAIGMMQSIAMVSQAQEAPKKEEKVQKVEVTGSSIKRTNTETASPVQVIKAEDIIRSGAANLTELLQTIPAITSGGQNDFTSGNGFAQGVATASLRGLGSASTLTLINGRRMAGTATADPNAGQSTLYNLNNIPMAAIERIDVLKDGASAIYGSDAIAGVVNIILKNEYKGLRASVRGSGASQGDFQTQGLSIFGGFGDYDDQNFNVMGGIDISNRGSTPLTRDKGFKAAQISALNWGAALNAPDSSQTFTPNYWPQTGVSAATGLPIFNTATPLPPTLCPKDQISSDFLTSKAPACVQDVDQYSRWVYPSKTASAFARASYKLSETNKAFFEFSVARLENPYTNGFATVSNGTSQWFDKNGVRRTFRYVMPANHPDNPLFIANPANKLAVLTSARLADIPRNSETIQTSSRFVAGVEGVNWGWDWQAGVMFNISKRDDIETGALNSLNAQAALDQYRFNGVNSPELLAKISPLMRSQGETKLTMIDLKGSREFGELPGGKIGVAAGTELRRESINMTPDANLDAGNYVGRGSSKAEGSRDVASLFVELNAPVLKSVVVEAAARYDRFSDYGNSVTPKLGLRWTPTDIISFRSTIAEGFRAPSLTQIAKSSVSSFQSINSWRDPVRCPTVAGVSKPIPGATGYDSANECNPASSSSTRSIASFIVANPNLKPETSRSATLGLVFAPTTKFSGTFDLWEIRRKNEIDRFSSDNVVEKFYQNGETYYGQFIFRNSDPQSALKDAKGNLIAGTEPIVGVKREYRNLGETITRGATLELSYKENLADLGRLNTTFYLDNTKVFKQSRDKGMPYIDLSDTGSLPKFKGRLSSSLNKGSYVLFGAVNYVSDYAVPRTNSLTGVRDTCSPTVAANSAQMAALGGDCRVASWTTFDFGVTYNGIKKLTMSATLRNAFNREAPYISGTGTYNSTLHTILGRNVSLNATYTFY